jgi:hypothetical protein
MVTAMMSLKTGKPVPLPQSLREKIEVYRTRTAEPVPNAPLPWASRRSPESNQ